MLGHRQQNAPDMQSGVDLRCTLEIEFVSCDIPTTENGCACIGMMTSLAADSAFVSRSPTEGSNQ